MSPFSKFKVNLSTQLIPADSESTVNNAPSTLFWDLAQPESSPTSSERGFQKLYGNFCSDSESGQYNRTWPSWDEFASFLAREQAANSIELRKVSAKTGGERYLERIVYVCARYRTGGEKTYEKKHPEWSRKIPVKSTDCPCSLKVKKYHNTPVILGKYDADHNHPTGVDNLRFTRMSDATRDWIAGMVRMHVKSDHIVTISYVNIDSNFELKEVQLEMAHNLREPHHPSSESETFATSNSTLRPHRNDFIVLADVRRIEKAIEAEKVRLNPNDAHSVFLWAERLQAEDSLLGFKSCACPVPSGSNLAADTFTFMVQTPSQREQFYHYGNNAMVFIDGTHNTTMYQNTTLTTILVRDHWGHGLPVAWMLASYGTEETIAYFLSLLRAANLSTIPWKFMTDRDFAQINAIRLRYPESGIWFCWWHVLHAWQQHFVISQNELLWTKLKALIRLEDPVLLDASLTEIKDLAPAPFWEYLVANWLPQKFVLMWSAIHRRRRGIHLLNDTNMLIEAWHHVLKGKFLEGRRNRRLDHLLHVLVDLVLPYYLLKERRQKSGFEGENLENQKRQQVVKSGKTIKAEDIKEKILEDSSTVAFLVRSASRLDHWYEVDILAYTCTCPDYPIIQFCKHLYAVQAHFPSSDIASAKELDALSTGVDVPPSAGQIVGLGFPACVVGISGTLDTDTDSGSLTEDSVPASDVLRGVAEKLERFAARFRQQGSVEQALRIDAWLDNEIPLETGSLLPIKQKLSPRLNSWPETQARMVSMPPKKKRAKRAGDQSYGAGESSGKKAKTLPKPVAAEVTEPPPVHPTITHTNLAQVVLPIVCQPAQVPVPLHPPSSYYRPKTHTY